MNINQSNNEQSMNYLTSAACVCIIRSIYTTCSFTSILY